MSLGSRARKRSRQREWLENYSNGQMSAYVLCRYIELSEPHVQYISRYSSELQDLSYINTQPWNELVYVFQKSATIIGSLSWIIIYADDFSYCVFLAPLITVLDKSIDHIFLQADF